MKKKDRKLHVRPLINLRNRSTNEPFVYIYMKKDGWFLASQLASHVFDVSLECIMLRIRCAMSQISSNKRRYMRFSRCTTLHDPIIINQIIQSGVLRETIRRNRIVVDMHTTRFLIRSFDEHTNGKMFHLFESILDLCYGPPDGIFHSRLDRNPLEIPETPHIISNSETCFQCSCGKHYKVLDKNTKIEEISFENDLDLVMGQPRRKKRRNTKITPSERLYILSLYDHKCSHCKTTIGKHKEGSKKGNIIPFEVDHRIERCKGGNNDIKTNLRPLCLRCHRYKTLDENRKPFL